MQGLVLILFGTVHSVYGLHVKLFKRSGTFALCSRRCILTFTISKTAVLITLVTALLLSNAFLLYQYSNHHPPGDPLAQSPEERFAYLNPNVANREYLYFQNQQNKYITNLFPLKAQLVDFVNAQPRGVFGIYFENLNTGAWVGINERESFIPASLLKLPVVVAILKRIDEGMFTLDTNVIIRPGDINTAYGAVGMLKPGDETTLRDLTNYTLHYSDNTAANTLFALMTPDDVLDAAMGLGLPARNVKNLTKDREVQISPKDYAHMLLSLYHASYLRRAHSNLVLSFLSNTAFHDGLPEGLPEGVRIAHKVGYRPDSVYGEQHHDCGIIYYPPSPYVLCIMTKGLTQEETDRFAKRVSEMTFAYMQEEIED